MDVKISYESAQPDRLQKMHRFKGTIILNLTGMQLHTFQVCFSELVINRTVIVLSTLWLSQTCLRCHHKLHRYVSKDTLQTRRSDRLSVWKQIVT